MAARLFSLLLLTLDALPASPSALSARGPFTNRKKMLRQYAKAVAQLQRQPHPDFGNSLWLLCRIQLLCIDLTIDELDVAATNIDVAVRRWETLPPRAPSWIASHAVGGSLARSFGRPPPAPALASLAPPTTKAGISARCELLRASRRACVLHVAALEDMSGALRVAGGEWLSQHEWRHAQGRCASLSTHQTRRLLLLSARCTAMLDTLCERWSQLGTYSLADGGVSALPGGSNAPAIAKAEEGVTVWAVLADARTRVRRLQRVQRMARRRSMPSGLAAPGLWRRHMLLWILAMVIIAIGGDQARQRSEALLQWAAELLLMVRRAPLEFWRFWVSHVNEPLAMILKEWREGSHPTIDPSEVKATKESLGRMLVDFVRERRQGRGEPSEDELRRAVEGSMEAVTEEFERQVRSPVSSLVSGGLLRTGLLQVQQLKALLVEELASVDTLLRRNDMNLQLMATVPAVLILVLLSRFLRGVSHLLRSSRGSPIDSIKRELVELELKLMYADSAEGEREATEDSAVPILHGGPEFGAAWPGASAASCLTHFSRSTLDLHTSGDLVLACRQLKRHCRDWLRGRSRDEALRLCDALMDGALLTTASRIRLARFMLLRLDKLSFLNYI